MHPIYGGGLNISKISLIIEADSQYPRYLYTRLTAEQEKYRVQEMPRPASGVHNIEFPRFDSRLTGNPSKLTLLMQRSAFMQPDVDGFDTVLSLGNGGSDCYRYEDGWIAEEHIHVPQPDTAAEDAGWILGTAYHWPTERTALSVFAAQRLADGPIARAHLPYPLPLGLHGQFVAA